MTTQDVDLAKLSVQLELQTAAFEDSVKQMDRQLKKMEANTKKSSKGIDQLNGAVAKLGKSFAGVVAGLSVGALAQAAREAIDYGDNIAKTAEKVGVTAAELQELRFAASQSGIEMRTLDMALQRFARRMGEAAQGTGELLKTTQELGIEFQDSDGRYFSTTELLEQYADAMGKAETQQEKLRLAFKAFDSEGAALVTLLGDGSEEMKELRAQAVELGLVMSDDLTDVAEGLNDQLDILTTQLKTQLSSALITATYRFANFFGLLNNQTDTTRLAFLGSEIERFRQEIVKLDSGEMRGGLIYIRERGLYISELAVEYNQLREKLGLVGKEEEELATSVDGTTNALTRRAEQYKAQLNPLIGLQKIIEDIQETVGSGLTQAQAWELITKAVAEYNKEIAGAKEKTDEVAESFDDFVQGIPRAIEEGTADLSSLEDIGIVFGETGDSIESTLEKIEKQMDGFITDFTNSFVDGLLTGEMAFDDFAKNILATIAKMLLNDIFTQFFDIIYSGIKGSLGLGPQSAINDSLRSLATYSAPTDGMARAGEASTMMVGQVVGKASATSSNKSPVTVNVNNYGDDEVSVSERQDSNGGIDIDILINQKVNKGFAEGSFDKIVKSTYGLRRLGY
jgi:chromosome segregation ATPase